MKSTNCRARCPHRAVKRVLSIILSLAMFLSITAGLDFSTYAATLSSSGSCGTNVSYTFDSSTGLVTISGSGAMKDWKDGSSSSSTYYTKNSFYNQSAIKTVVIENGVTSIGNYAFYGCTGLTNVTIPDSVTSIGSSAFYDCTGLTSITIPDSVSSIGSSAFYDCTGLTSITIPDSVSSIGDYAFSGCTGLTKVNISSIEAWCRINFYNSNSNPLQYAHNLYFNGNIINDLVIPDSVTTIGSYAFYNCTGLTSITIPDSVSSIGDYAFSGCTGLTSITIPDSVSSIGSSAFSVCTGIKELKMPCSAKIYNSQYTFAYCTNIEKVILTKGTGTMQNYSSSTGNSDTYYQYTPWFISRAKCEEIILENGITSIGNYAFRECTGLTSITIPDSVTSIGANAFYGCTGLTSITIPDSVSSIGENAFNSLTEVTIPEASKFDFSGFDECTNLTKINISASTGKMADWSVDYADSLWYKHRDTIREVELEEGIENISESAFYNCSNLIKTNIPSTVKSIGAYAYFGCSNLKSLTVSSQQCDIPMSQSTIDPLATIYGYNSSTAQKYAREYGRDFVSLGSNPCSTHTVETDTAVAPTCTETGLTEGTHCSVCGEIITEQTIIAATGHKTVVDKSVAPTCSKDGLTEGSHCSECGKVLIRQETINALGHDYEIYTAQPTCSSLGYTVYLCKNCGDSFKADFVPIVENHTYVSAITKQPTCTTKGVKTFTCSLCGDSYTEDIDMLEHTAVTDEAVASTCTKTGLTAGSHCSVCGTVLTEQQIVNAKGHTPVSSNNAIEPTCSEAGKESDTKCSECGERLLIGKTIPANGHSYESVVTAPTCKTQGYTTYTCSDCGASYKSDYTPTTDKHDYKGATTKLPTCTAEGVKTFTCSICCDMYTEPIEKLEHTAAVDNAVEPTCEETGLTEGSHCSDCGEILVKQEVIDATGHTEVIDEAVPATFKAAGKTEGKHCSVCGKILVAQKAIAKLGAPALSKVTAGSKQFKTTWKSVANIDGYEIQYSTSSSFKSGNKTVTVKGYKSTSKTVKSLKAKKKYYVRIRAYKTINGKKQYSAWSKSKSVTTKK